MIGRVTPTIRGPGPNTPQKLVIVLWVDLDMAIPEQHFVHRKRRFDKLLRAELDAAKMSISQTVDFVAQICDTVV